LSDIRNPIEKIRGRARSVSVVPALTPSELGSVVLHEPIPARSRVANSL
jgi:hypothetical protein